MINPEGVTAGDKGETVTGTLGGVLSLVGATAVCVVDPVKAAAETAAVELPVSIDDAVLRTFTVDLGTANDDWLPSEPAEGVYNIVVRVTFSDDSVLTFPRGAPDKLYVKAKLV